MNKFIYIIILALVSGCKGMPLTDSPFFNGKTFVNLDDTKNKSLFDVLKWKMSSEPKIWPTKMDQNFKATIPVDMIINSTKITFINHSTFLIQMNGINILTDPIWANRASPFSFLGPIRHQLPGIEFEKLPKIDLVLISHNHYDHMDKETIINLDKKFSPLFIVPLNNSTYLNSFGVKKVIELDWWHEHKFNDEVKITLTPARHWSRRTLFDTNQAFWGSFMIDGFKRVYFGGDTGLGIHFHEINKKFKNIDVSLLPIGAYEPRWFMKDAHMNPEDAVVAHKTLESKFSIGMHFGLFQLTDEGIEDPAIELEKVKANESIQNFVAPKIGEEFNFI